MEKPDADGFVNITWPSNSVPHGGVFHTRIVEPSEDTRQFLKVLLDESKLSIEQREKFRWESQLRREEESRRHSRQKEPVYYTRPKTSRRRSLSVIKESGVYEIDTYRPLKRSEDREQLKQRLQRYMECGVSDEQQPPRPPPPPKKRPELPTPRRMRNELINQIRERAEWLAEMEVLGEAAAHRDIIRDQIAERLRALDALGLDSPCSTARSTLSGFSTTRSREIVASARSATSLHSGRGKKAPSVTSARNTVRASTRREKNAEENVTSYEKLPPLAYSPRRRC